MCKSDNLIAGIIVVTTGLIILGAVAIMLIDTLQDWKNKD